MFKKFLVALFAVMLSFSLSIAEEFKVDKSHSQVMFVVKHMMISNVSGTFSDYSAQVDYDTADKKFLKLVGEVDTTTVNTGIEKRDDHLRSGDFFEVTKFPKMKFVMSEYIKESDEKGKMVGTLTIRDVSKKVTFDVEIGGVVNDPWGNLRLGTSMETKVNRKDFGLSWNKALESGGLVVGDTVKIKIDLELIKK